MTDWEEEIRLCRWDVVRWAWVFLGIKMHPGQALFANAYLRRTKSRWRALYLWIMVAAGNRAGKTMALAIIILHSCVYRMGLQPPDPSDPDDVARWGRLPYHWWHFAVEQAPAEQVFTEIATMLGGIHPAQKKGCPWADRVGGAEKIATMTETGVGEWAKGPKERGEYAWIKLNPELGGAEIHFRSTKAKALSAIGQSMHGLSFDEAGLETNLVYLLEEVMHARRITTGGQFIIISTPSAATSTDFEDLWITGDPEDPFREQEGHEQRFSMRMSTRDNISYGIDEETFDAMLKGQPEDWIAQNIDGFFIQAQLAWFNATSIDGIFYEAMPEEESPQDGSTYIHALDPGLKDKMWSLVCKVRADGRIVGVFIDRVVGKQTTRRIVRLGKTTHHRYAKPKGSIIETGVDTTALGGHIFKELLEEDDPEGMEDGLPGIPTRSIEFGGNSQVKRRLLSDLRSAIDEGLLVLPAAGYWAEARKQLRNYKLLDRKIEQDIVMSLAIIVKLLRSAALPVDSTKPAREPTRLDMTAGVPVSVKQLTQEGEPRILTEAEVAARSRGLRAALAEKRRRRRLAETGSAGVE